MHLHARDPQTGKGSMQLEYYKDIVDQIRNEDPNVIINLTTGEGGRFVPGSIEPREPESGTTLVRPEIRVSHVETLKPEICTLDFNTMWSGNAVVINSPQNIKIMADRIYSNGVKPEIEIFDSSDLHMLKHFIELGIIKTPVMVQMVLGVRYGAVANPQTMAYLVSQLPDDCLWAGFGIGRMEFPMVAQAWLLGGHIRVGMEDNLYISKGKLTSGNAELVTKARVIVEHLGGQIATPDDARQMLAL